MLIVSALYIYPVKSLGGIRLTAARLTDRGLEWDRRWMLTDEQGHFLSQREHPELALFSPSLHADKMIIQHRRSGKQLAIPLQPVHPETLQVQVWDDQCPALKVSAEADAWFSEALGLRCHLVYMPAQTHRRVDPDFARLGEITSFSDAFPLMAIGQASLDDLNKRLSHPVPMNRFRPNIVFEGGCPYEEDELAHFRINGVDFYGVKPCARCVITTTDQNTLERGTEPLRTLSSYRRLGHKVLFGQNLLYKGTGEIHVGDIVEVQATQASPLPSVPGNNNTAKKSLP